MVIHCLVYLLKPRWSAKCIEIEPLRQDTPTSHKSATNSNGQWIPSFAPRGTFTIQRVENTEGVHSTASELSPCKLLQMTFQWLFTSLKKQAKKQNGSVALFNTPFFVVDIIPSAICHTNGSGGSKTPQHYKRGGKKKLHKTHWWQTAYWWQQFVQRLQT